MENLIDDWPVFRMLKESSSVFYGYMALAMIAAAIFTLFILAPGIDIAAWYLAR